MSAPQPFDLATTPATPWKNGGGATREIAVWPADASMANFDARVSVADVMQDGPFSTFDGVDRVITLLHGAGLRLRGDGIDHALTTPFAPFAFAGEVPLHATALGASQDFNLMLRRGRVRGAVTVHADAAMGASQWGVLLAWSGTWTVHDHKGGAIVDAIHAGQGIVWSHGLHWHAQPSSKGGTLLAVSLHPVTV